MTGQKDRDCFEDLTFEAVPLLPPEITVFATETLTAEQTLQIPKRISVVSLPRRNYGFAFQELGITDLRNSRFEELPILQDFPTPGIPDSRNARFSRFSRNSRLQEFLLQEFPGFRNPDSRNSPVLRILVLGVPGFRKFRFQEFPTPGIHDSRNSPVLTIPVLGIPGFRNPGFRSSRF